MMAPPVRARSRSLRRPLRPVLWACAWALACALACALVGPSAAATAPAAAQPGGLLRLATWNLEWLVTPETFAQLAPHCTRAGQERRAARSLPCDVVAEHERSATDLAGLAHYARVLDADVVALQEVDGIAAARQVFPGYEFCFTGGPAIQKTGFAVRAGLPHRCGPDLQALSLGDTLRRGALLVLYPGTPRELTLLGVHLKSGCPRARLEASLAACERLRRQLPLLAEWLREQQAAGHQHALLGDFNRDLLADARRAGRGGAGGVWAGLVAIEPRLGNSAAGEPHANCRRGQLSTGFIDYILLGGTLAASSVTGSFRRLAYEPGEAWRLKLSDHCPVALALRLD